MQVEIKIANKEAATEQNTLLHAQLTLLWSLHLCTKQCGVEKKWKTKRCLKNLFTNPRHIQEEKEKRKAREEAEESVKRETFTHKGGYLKYWNNDWKGKRAGRLDGAKEYRHTVPTGNKVEREYSMEHWRWMQTILQRS